MLVVESVVPGGPADGLLEPGDVVARLGGAVVTEFLGLEAALDAAGEGGPAGCGLWGLRLLVVVRAERRAGRLVELAGAGRLSGCSAQQCCSCA